MAMELRAPEGATKNKRVVGRGTGSTKGGTSGRGHDGQNSRSGGGVRPGFEGGQMPLYRRVARRGFSNARFKTEYVVLNLDDLCRKFADGDTVNAESLKAKGLVKQKKAKIKVLGNGDIAIKLNVQVDKLSASAAEKIEKAGGKILKEEGHNG